MSARLLIACGTETECSHIADCLAGLELEILFAMSGEAALEQVQEHSFAFVILGLSLPDMNGIEVAKFIRCDRANAHLPLILLSSPEQQEALRYRAHEAGVSDHLAKPLQRGLIRSKARLYLDLYASVTRLQREAERLRKSNHELLEFAHAAAHDLRAPLRAIQHMSARLGQSGPDEGIPHERRDLAASIAQSVSRMNAMVGGMLEYARIDRLGQTEEAVDLNRCLDEVLSDLQTELLESEGSIERELLPVVTGHSSQLRRVLLNILGNAIKYRRLQVPPRIVVRAQVVDGVASVAIEDNGTGFAMKYADALFFPFRRLVPASRVEGSGIGMATARKIVEFHGGTLTATSILNRGSIFVMTLPMTTPEITAFRRAQRGLDPAATHVAGGREAPVPEEPKSRTPTVLVVDDDVADRRAVAAGIGPDVRILEAESAEEALGLLDSRVGLVVTDYHMPGEDGLFLIQQVAAAYPRTHRILMSDAPGASCYAALEGGVIHRILEKPVCISDLATLSVCANEGCNVLPGGDSCDSVADHLDGADHVTGQCAGQRLPEHRSTGGTPAACRVYEIHPDRFGANYGPGLRGNREKG